MQNNTLNNICKNIPQQKIIVIGDVMLDHFVYGSVDRISPESPVPILAQKREDIMLGGASNSFANLLGLKTNAELMSVIGDDEYGEKLKMLLTQQGASADHLITDPARPTSYKTRFLAGHQQLLRVDLEKKSPITSDIENKIIEKFSSLITDTKTVILSDYGKGILTKTLIQSIITIANDHNVPVIVDPKGTDFTIYKGAYAITPNRKELSEATNNLPTKSDEDIIKASQLLIKSCDLGAVIATRSDDGISIIKKGDKNIHHIRPTEKVDVFDVSGAGDTVIATIAATIATGASLETAAHLANIAGHIAVTKVGTSPIRLEEVESAIEKENAPHRVNVNASMLTSPQEAIEQIKRWHAKGLKIGFTNGCFDILHAGHVTYLNEAHNHCDRLIVGLNSDTSVKVLKGDSRPIHDENARAAVIGSLSSVDMVILFGAKKSNDDNTACALLDMLKPDIYFKGGDYTIKQIPEAPTVLAYDGQVKVLQIVEGYSTSIAIEKSKQS